MNELSLKATAIGSLPHTDTESAVKLIRETYTDIPFWMQLSKVDALQDMTVQFSQMFPGLILDKEKRNFKFDSESERFAEELEILYSDYFEITEGGNTELLEKYAIKEPYTTTIEPIMKFITETKPKFAKGQIVGPFTWGTMLTDSEGKCLFYDETYRDIVVKTLTLKAIWQIERFKKANPEIKPIIFIDEPTVSQLGTSAFMTVTSEEVISALNEIIHAIKERGAYAAIHCCGKADWGMILKTDTDIINFDAYSFGKNILTFSKELNTFFKEGKYAAWGIVPTLDEESLERETAENLAILFEKYVEALRQKGTDEALIYSQSLITPTCGAGGLSIKNAEKAMKLTKEVSDRLRKNHGGTK